MHICATAAPSRRCANGRRLRRGPTRCTLPTAPQTRRPAKRKTKKRERCAILRSAEFVGRMWSLSTGWAYAVDGFRRPHVLDQFSFAERVYGLTAVRRPLRPAWVGPRRPSQPPLRYLGKEPPPWRRREVKARVSALGKFLTAQARSPTHHRASSMPV
jgi:hypothetical protein